MREGIVKQVQRFREHIYHFFRHRRDAAMELVDALSSNTHASSVVELSLNPVHRRNYCSITRVIDEYASTASAFEKQCQKKELTRLLSRSVAPLKKRNHHVFAVDCTPQPRISAPTLADRGIVHAPNPILGNKPITLGHQYSVAVYLPEKLSTDTPPWVIPLSCDRVSTEKKGTRLGMEQISRCIAQPLFQGNLCVSVGDCAYSDSYCLQEAYKNPNQIHISRAKNNRLFYRAPKKRKNRLGRPKLFGKKFPLKSKRRRKPDEFTSINMTTATGKELTLLIEGWNEMLMRGKREVKTQTMPFRLVRIQVFNKKGERVFKRPMWLIASGERRHELSLQEIYLVYRQRFDIEHFFKFGKNRLLMDKTQTPDVEHEEAWWQLSIIAYAQLYVGRQLAQHRPAPWQKYLNEFKSTTREKSPTQVQKSFYEIIQEIGTPAQPLKRRNKSTGRKKGDLQVKRQHHPVIIKRKIASVSEKMMT